MERRGYSPWLTGLAIGTVTGLVVAVAVTVRDWRLNPGGIFHGAEGTDWSIVAETALSWFVPVTLLVTAIAVPVLQLLRRRR